ncbi:MAG TPA: GAF domain-containing protein, partial [Candidatus Acidoferrales bacterium]|nr:GAF domain-containing protein [Candidatus Acidoferrales bacterium]
MTTRSSTVLQAAAAGLAADPGPVVGALLERPEAAAYAQQLRDAGELPEEVLSTLIEILAGPLQRPSKLSLYESWERVRELGQRSAAGGTVLEELLEVVGAVREEVLAGLAQRGLPEPLLRQAGSRLEETVEKVAAALTRGYLDDIDQRYQAEHRELMALINLAQALNSSLEVQAVAEAGLLQILRVMRLQAGAVWMRQDGELRLLKSASLAPQHEPEEELEDELEMRALVEKGSPLVASALQASVPIQDRAQSELKSRAAWSVAASSLRSKGELLGVMAVATRQPRVFSQPE